MKYVIKFSKKGYMKYISHLDLLRLFKRALKKGNIALVHSQGFNPHPKITFAQPLSLGYTSTCELVEIETKENLNADILSDILQDMLHRDIKILMCEKLDANKKSPVKNISQASYLISIEKTEGLTLAGIDKVLNQDKIITWKKQKKKKDLKEIDIKPLIKEIDTNEHDNKIIMTTKLYCGSVSNLNPDLIIRAIKEKLSLEIPPENIQIERISLK